MLKPSDFNNAVPQFKNGNYASNPINPQYVEEPSSTDYNRGAEPLQTLPAQWWNWFINKFTSRFNKVNIYVKNLFNELAQLLSLVNVTPDGTEGSVTDGQLKNAFKELYPTYVSDKLELGTTYVPPTREVNGHALTGNVTVSKSDVGLGNVANTGDSANASSGGTTKFTTGGAYNLLSSIAPYFSTSTVYAVGALITYQNKLYECTTAHSAGEWNASHFTARSIQYVISNYILPSIAPAFSTSTSYAVGAFVTYQNKLYRCISSHSAGAWNSSHFTAVTVGEDLSVINGQLNGHSKMFKPESNVPYWIKALECSYYYLGQVMHLNIVSQSGTSQGSSHALTICFSNNSENIVDLARDINSSFDKIRIYESIAQRKVIIYVHYAKYDADIVSINFTFTDTFPQGAILHWTKEDPPSDVNYREYDLLQNGFNILGSVPNLYINGQNRLPSAPAVDGEYALSASVESDTPSFSWVEKTPVPEQNSNNLFTTGGAYDFFGGNTKSASWINKVFGYALCRDWKTVNTSVGTMYYLNDFFISSGAKWSTDGLHWTQGTVQGAESPSFSDVKYANGIYVSCGRDRPFLQWSTDGKNWTPATGIDPTEETEYFTNIEYGNGLWVATGGSIEHNGAFWSTDGKAWTQGTVPNNIRLYDAKYANNIWVATSWGHGIFYSTDGKAWTQASGAPTTEVWFGDIAYANGTFVTGCWSFRGYASKGTWWSDDGMNWTECTGIDTSYYTSGIYYAKGIWLSRKSSSGIIISTDGKAWETTNITTGSAGGFCYANGLFVCILSGRICVATDPYNWYKTNLVETSEDSDSFANLLYAKNKWLLSGDVLRYSDYSVLVENGFFTD